jgi:hypothetical protein
MSRRNVRWLLLGCCVVMLAGCTRRAGEEGPPQREGEEGPPPPSIAPNDRFPALPPHASSDPDANGLLTQIRPQVARVGDDPLRIVLHWETKKGPLTFSNDLSSSWHDLCNGLTVHVVTPDGKKLDLQPEPQPPNGGSPDRLSETPTLFLVLGPTGLAVTHPCSYQAPWKGGRQAALNAAGAFRVWVSGTIVPAKDEPKKGREPIAFASPAVKVERGAAGCEPLDEIARLARNKLDAKLKGREVRPLVYDDADGNRLVYLTGPSEKQWHFVAYTVRLSPSGEVLNVFSKEVSNCVAEGTPLDGEAGPVAVEHVRAGDRLWGRDLRRGRRVLTTVRHVRRAEAVGTLRFGCGLRATGGHPVYASGEWKPAQNVGESDELLGPGGERIRAGKVERLAGRVAVYDLTVDEPHNFFAAGVLVHNKSRAPSPEHDDLWYVLWSPRKAGG